MCNVKKWVFFRNDYFHFYIYVINLILAKKNVHLKTETNRYFLKVV